VSRQASQLAPPLVRFDAVTLRLFGEEAFPHTSWTFEPGQQWAMVGATGAGKSTFLRAVLGEISYSAGRIDYGLDGRRLREGEYRADALQLVSAAQHRALVAAAMDFHQARWSPVDERELVAVRHLIGRRRPAWLPLARELEIEPLWGRAIGSLSNGEMRKVLLSRALVAAPRLLLLDNPFAGLDRASRHHLHRALDRLVRRGLPRGDAHSHGELSVLLATARLDEIPRFITHVLYLEDGRVAAQGERNRILRLRPVQRLGRSPGRSKTRRALRWGTRSVGRAAPGARLSGAAPRAPRPGKRGGRRSGSETEPAAPLIDISRAEVTYDRARILRRVTWTVRAGENWVLRGRNGSGKSTLISLVTGDNPQAYANDIRLFGTPRGSGESIWEIKERIGWMAPELQFHYYGDVTCWEVVCSGLYDTVGLYRDSSAREARAVRRWLGNLDVQALADEPFGNLSDGQQRLVLLARALVKEPPLLIFDEPCQGLDARHRDRVLALLDQVARQPHTTVIYVTHHAEEIPRSFGCELHLGRGRVLYRGPRRAP